MTTWEPTDPAGQPAAPAPVRQPAPPHGVLRAFLSLPVHLYHEQTILARWFLKTAIAINTSQNYRLLLPREVRHAVSTGMPSDVKVFLARHSDPKGGQLNFAQTSGAATRAVDLRDQQATVGEGCVPVRRAVGGGRRVDAPASPTPLSSGPRGSATPPGRTRSRRPSRVPVQVVPSHAPSNRSFHDDGPPGGPCPIGTQGAQDVPKGTGRVVSPLARVGTGE